MLHRWLRWSILALAYESYRCQASLLFVSGPEQLMALPPIYCPPWNTYVGPQNGDDGLRGVRSRLVWFEHDPCDADAVERVRPAIDGRAVLLGNQNPMCAPSHLYSLFQSANATFLAVIDESPVPTGGGLMADDVYGKRRHTGTMLFVRFHLDADLAALLVRTISGAGDAAGVIIDAHPDRNVWLDMTASWWYVVFVCALPALYFGVCAAFAASYLFTHVARFVTNASDQDVFSRPRSVRARVSSQWGIPQTALLIEAATTLVLCVSAVSGFGGVLNGTYLGVCLMQSQLSGPGCSCTLLSAIFWGRCRDKLLFGRPATTPFGVFAERHETLWNTILWTLVALPTIADVLVNVLIANRIAQQFFLGAYTLIFMAIYLVIAVYFFQQARTFRREVANILKDVDPERLAFVAGISRWTTRAGICMAFAICVLPFGATIWIWTPTGWTVFWALTPLIRAGNSFCHIQEFRPRTTRTQPESNCRPGGGPVPIHERRS
ncbi:Receptor ligand binding region domain-containing protein [Plasmodiophora brassicae]